MKDYIHNHVIIALGLIVIALGIVLGAWFAHVSKKDFLKVVEVKITETRAQLQALAEITDWNGAEETIETIIVDCPRRADYEALLNRLSTLEKKDLITLQNLSESCGGFYAERKALMVAKLKDEFETYQDLIELRLLLTEQGSETYDISKWEEIVMLENTRSTLLVDQKQLQEKIISSLLLGKRTESAEVQSYVREAQEIGQLLEVHDKKIDDLREQVKH